MFWEQVVPAKLAEKSNNTAKQNLSVVNEAIKEAIAKKHAILMIIDDYHNIHTIRRPSQGNVCKVDNMAKLINKIVEQATAIPISSVNLIHNPCGIDADFLVNNSYSNQFFSQISSSLFASSMPGLTRSFFDQVMGRYEMETHDNLGQGSRSLRSFKDVYLIDFVTLPLKVKTITMMHLILFYRP